MVEEGKNTFNMISDYEEILFLVETRGEVCSEALVLTLKTIQIDLM
jgi:hypothetical protein